jgi:tetratricopeptide (TPR) repeat protein
MTFEEFISQGWSDHATDSEGVLSRLPQGIDLIAEARHLPAFAGLCVHVAGEHLGRWADGIALLDRLDRHPAFDPATAEGKAVARSKAVLYRCAGDHAEESRCLAASVSGGDIPEASDRIRVLAVAAAAYLGQKRLAEARRDFEEAAALAGYGPAATDPAARALAITGNNIACELEERPALTDEERSVMLHAAEVARRFWGVAGGWMETERAEYRLAMSCIKAGDPARALAHARRCLVIVEENGSDPGEEFFGREAVARAHLAAGDAAQARKERDGMATLLPSIPDESFRGFCEGEFAKLEAALGQY